MQEEPSLQCTARTEQCVLLRMPLVLSVFPAKMSVIFERKTARRSPSLLQGEAVQRLGGKGIFFYLLRTEYGQQRRIDLLFKHI